ncbi:conserved hypothetical protein [Bradyrhizobium sp. STM 3843]|uniref:hypothetical protein n=1 Tax=Bradyrhizobium sp. STM 3843 TaxID=551947 RepID=UPI0002403058|nr:hypothetical protein [Bradyrhizobium sp. STM 3843]CCE08240.1 conserved hypothetical protein [Bradyrhizobium sp. STM 3843]
MAGYCITALGAGFAVGTDDGAVLICRTMKLARRVVADAERLERTPPRARPQRASSARHEAPAEAVDFAELEGLELMWRTA